jgi:hypothetical protein
MTNAADRPLIRFHIGAPKTATTILHTCLRTNSKQNPDQSRFYIENIDLRRTLRNCDRKERQTVGSAFFRAVPAGGVGLFSEENALGRCNTIVESGELYADIAGASKKYREFFGPESAVELFLVIRSYDTFAVSAFGEGRRSGAYRPFDDFAAAIKMETFNWERVPNDLAAVFPESPIVVMRYEDLRADYRMLLDPLAGEVGRLLKLPEKAARTSPTADAIRLVDLVASEFGGTIALQFQKAAEAVFDSDRSPRYDPPWPSGRARDLREMYDEHWKSIQQHGRFLIPQARERQP